MENNNTKNPITIKDKGLQLRTLEDAYRFAQYVVASRIAPSSFKTPEQVLIALQTGWELGMPPMRSLQSFAVINGQCRLYGDTPLALVRQSGLLEYIKEWIEGEDDDRIAFCETKRKGDKESIVRKFSVKDAKLAGLWSKQGTWQQYPERMLQLRARSLNLRDAFPDVFGGATIAEEYIGVEMTSTEEIEPKTNKLLGQEKAEEQPKSAELLTTGKAIEELEEFAEENIGKIEKENNVPDASVLDDYEYKCLKCGEIFNEPGGQGAKPLCPKCLSSKLESL